MRRVMVVGCSGAGKTTLAQKISEWSELPLINLDSYYWSPGWTATSCTEWREQVEQLSVAPEWIMDGNYWTTFAVRMRYADTLIWLDYSRRICLWRVLKRTMRWFGRSRPELPGCPERFTWSFLRHVWCFRSEYRPRILDAIRQFGSHLRVIQVANGDDADEFLAELALANDKRERCFDGK